MEIRNSKLETGNSKAVWLTSFCFHYGVSGFAFRFSLFRSILTPDF
jgi:nitrate reductase gamma subunit